MTAKLNRDEVLRGILRTLVDGWGYRAVRASLESMEGGGFAEPKRSRTRDGDAEAGAAVTLVNGLKVPSERRALLQALAVRYDEGSAFPTLGDARAFLLSHHRGAKDIKSRSQAFKLMLPLLAQMSEKGLEKVISRSHHSGPADLDAISKAIRGAGEDMRGPAADEPAPSIDRESSGTTSNRSDQGSS